MKQKEFNKVLSYYLEINEELYELVESCFDEIFQSDALEAKGLLDEDMRSFEFNGCLQGVAYFQTRISENKKRFKDWEMKMTKQSAQKDVKPDKAK